MASTTKQLWDEQNRHEGDRARLFTAVGTAVDAEEVLYAGSFVDVAPSFVFPSVTYIDTDQRAAAFFADEEGVRAIIGSHPGAPGAPRVRFIHGDYSHEHGLPLATFDLLISLYAGFVSAECTEYLRIGGTLLVNPSHGDAAMASIDSRYALSGVITSDRSIYKVRTEELDTYLSPKKPIEITRQLLRERGRGIAYTRSPFAYLFRRTS